MWRSQAEAEGLTLLKADNKAVGVHLKKPGQPKPYHAQVRRGGKVVSLGSFATVEEAALCIARSPEGQEAAARRLALIRKLRAAARIVATLLGLYKAVLEKTYAPSGAGYMRARDDFEAHRQA